MLVEGGSDDDDYVYISEECSFTTTIITDGSNSNGNDNVITNRQEGIRDSSENNAILTTSLSVEKDQSIHSSLHIALTTLSTSTNPSSLPSNNNINNVDNTPSTTSTTSTIMNYTNLHSIQPVIIRCGNAFGFTIFPLLIDSVS